MLSIEHDTWNVQMLSILQRLVDPGLKHLRAHLWSSSTILGRASLVSFLVHDVCARIVIVEKVVLLSLRHIFQVPFYRIVTSDTLHSAGRTKTLPHLLGHDGDVDEAFERRLVASVDLWEL